MFTWNADMIRFMRDASEFTPFHEQLAERAAAYIAKDAHVCDAGCGLGYLSLALAGRCAQVSAIDISAQALAVLRENLAARKIGNVRALQADVFAPTQQEGAFAPQADADADADAQQTRFDAMVFCFFGGTQEILRCAKAHCSGSVVLFKKDWTTHRFAPGKLPPTRLTFAQTCHELADAGVPFHSETFALDMGQPFRSLADAEQFFHLHAQSSGKEAPGGERLYSELAPTGSATFPYYLKSKRPVGMIVLDTKDILDYI